MTIRLPNNIKENLQFLIAEVDSQVGSLEHFLATPSFAQARRILDRSGYAYSLKTRIHDDAINRLSQRKKNSLNKLVLRSSELIATDLDRICELIRDVVKHVQYMDNTDHLHDDLASLLLLLREGLSLMLPAIDEKSSKQALSISQISDRIEKQYEKLTLQYEKNLSQAENFHDVSRALLVIYAVEQMGQSLTRISESIVSANLGQPVTMERYSSLRSLVSQMDTNEEDLNIVQLAETRSGSNISGIRHKQDLNDDNKSYLAIFKDGVKDKVKEERQGVESWHQIYPGLAPKILSYKKKGESAALLIEHLPGQTFEQILLGSSDELLDQALSQLGKTLTNVWEQTKTDKTIAASFLGQTKKRLPEVYRIHPEFNRPTQHIGDYRSPSLSELLTHAEAIEKTLSAPFSVHIHGDFNVDNILYDPIEKRINFIDLHRSRTMDFVQDVSVFMVSHYRLRILDNSARQRILQVPLLFYKTARRFARKHQDETFELRLALGLVRSFITSTRFILDKSLSRRMMLRAIYIIEQILKADLTNPKRFKLNLQEIFVE